MLMDVEQEGENPNSNDDFVIDGPHRYYKLLCVDVVEAVAVRNDMVGHNRETRREGFAKVFRWSGLVSEFEWTLRCEYASSKTGTWQQAKYTCECGHTPEEQASNL